MTSMPPPPPGSFAGPPAGFGPATAGGGGARRGRTRAAAPSKTAARPTRRALGVNRLLFLAAAAALVLLVVMHYYSTASNVYEAVYSQSMVAGATLGQYTSGTTPPTITAVVVPKSMLLANGFTGSTQAAAIDAAVKGIPAGSQTIGAIPAGTPVLASQFATALVPAATLGSDQLISLTAQVQNALGGSLQVGNYVDVYVSTGGQPGSPATLIASNVQIIAIHASVDQYSNIASQQSSDRTLNPTDVLPTNPVPGIYILQVTPQVAAKVANAQGGGGSFYLAYVSPPAS